jgi:nicotinamide mononucleotide transporter
MQATDTPLTVLPEALLASAFELWGSPVTFLEIAAVLMSVAMVIGNLRVKVWAWPLAIAASASYGLLFWGSRLYGEAMLQLFFIAVSAWGWSQWRRAESQTEADLGVGRMTAPARLYTLLGTLAAWPLLGLLLASATDSDVPFADALPTVASVTGQVLLALKRVETWWVWLGVNLFSVALFAYKELWLTALLYALFAALSWFGLRAWQQRLKAHG